MSNLNKLIRISDTTYEKLSELGKFRDNFDSIISRVLEEKSRLER